MTTSEPYEIIQHIERDISYVIIKDVIFYFWERESVKISDYNYYVNYMFQCDISNSSFYKKIGILQAPARVRRFLLNKEYDSKKFQKYYEELKREKEGKGDLTSFMWKNRGNDGEGNGEGE